MTTLELDQVIEIEAKAKTGNWAVGCSLVLGVETSKNTAKVRGCSLGRETISFINGKTQEDFEFEVVGTEIREEYQLQEYYKTVNASEVVETEVETVEAVPSEEATNTEAVATEEEK